MHESSVAVRLGLRARPVVPKYILASGPRRRTIGKYAGDELLGLVHAIKNGPPLPDGHGDQVLAAFGLWV